MPRATPLPPDERRAAIMAATEPLLVAHGRDVSTRQIAAAAGVAEGTIFRVFDGKEALIDAVLQDAFDVEITCRVLAGIDPAAELELRLVEAVTALQERLRRVFALFHSLALRRDRQPDPERHAQHTQDNRRLNAALAEVIAPDADQLRLEPDDAADLIKTLTFAASHPLMSDRRHSDPKQIVDIVLHGIAARDGIADHPRKAQPMKEAAC